MGGLRKQLDKGSESVGNYESFLTASFVCLFLCMLFFLFFANWVVPPSFTWCKIIADSAQVHSEFQTGAQRVLNTWGRNWYAQLRLWSPPLAQSTLASIVVVGALVCVSQTPPLKPQVQVLWIQRSWISEVKCPLNCKGWQNYTPKYTTLA